MNICFLTLLAALAVSAEGHEQKNPVYRELRQTGVAVAASARARLPAPVLADGLSAEAQEAALKAALGDDYSFAEFTRRSAVAPNKLQIRDVSPSAPGAPARRVDVVAVAYGDLKAVASKKFLETALERNREGGKAHALTPGELARRDITVRPGDAKHEGFAHFSVALLDRVQLSGVGHSYWSRTEDSVVAAGLLDPRFKGDAAFPNQWRPIVRGRGDRKELGPAVPYAGAGYYVKITRLAKPEGALFVECHLVFTEPRKWFGGANLLRSKLPPAIQSQVRAFRRELARASR